MSQGKAPPAGKYLSLPPLRHSLPCGLVIPAPDLGGRELFAHGKIKEIQENTRKFKQLKKLL